MCVAVAAAGCAQQPAAADPCTGESERARAVARKIKDEWPLRGSDEVTRLVKDVMRRLARFEAPRRWEISIVRNRRAEAYSIGDGRIYVSDGALRVCRTESELAAILAHEMAHQSLGHFCRPPPVRRGPFGLPRTIGSVALRIDPERELAADREGLDLMARASYDPRAALVIARRVARATPGGHLDAMGRVARLERLMPRYRGIPGYQSDDFERVRRILLAERPLR